MATDEEKYIKQIGKEFWTYDSDNNMTFSQLVKRVIKDTRQGAIKKGIEIGKKEGKKEGTQIERKRIRKQVKEVKAICGSILSINDIDIWDDVK